jgi:ABC-type nickel/cobalt efflux system permease component RcnA
MSTGLIIALIVIGAVLIIALAAFLALRARRPRGGSDLRRRFGPEYDRAVARHDGDTKAAERELTERLERHGDLRPEPLDPARRERFEARWAAAQELFVEAPRAAVSEADHLLAEAAEARGYPDSAHYDDQLSALSVHHAQHVQGYRHVHRLAHQPDGQDTAGQRAVTEEMREAMVEARELFEDLVGAGAGGANTKGSRGI